MSGAARIPPFVRSAAGRLALCLAVDAPGGVAIVERPLSRASASHLIADLSLGLCRQGPTVADSPAAFLLGFDQSEPRLDDAGEII